MFKLPKLEYEYSSLEPHIDARTMEIHHSKHHAGYVEKLNTALAGTDFEGKSIEEILSSSDLPTAIRNNGGGHWNHTFFWDILSSDGGGEPRDELKSEIEKTFGGFDSFKEKFEKASLGRFGSGWTWLVKTAEGLKIASTPNQDNPLMFDAEIKGEPILALDVWEHAYYLNYQNKRAEYIKAFWNVVNWNKISEKYEG